MLGYIKEDIESNIVILQSIEYDDICKSVIQLQLSGAHMPLWTHVTDQQNKSSITTFTITKKTYTQGHGYLVGPWHFQSQHLARPWSQFVESSEVHNFIAVFFTWLLNFNCKWCSYVVNYNSARANNFPKYQHEQTRVVKGLDFPTLAILDNNNFLDLSYFPSLRCTTTFPEVVINQFLTLPQTCKMLN